MPVTWGGSVFPSGGSSTPGGSSGEVQFNNGGSLDGVHGSSVTPATGAITLTSQGAAVTPLAIVPHAGQTAPLILFGADTGLARGTAGMVTATDGSAGLGSLEASDISLGANRYMRGLGTAADGLILWGSDSVRWRPSSINQPADTGLARASAGVVKVTDGSTGAGSILVADGSAAAPSVAFASEATLGFYRPNAGAVGILIGGTKYFHFYSSGLWLAQNSAGISARADQSAFMTWPGAATLQLGKEANATPVANTLIVGESGSGTDIAGANGVIQSGAGTGSGAGSTLTFKTPTPGTGGTSTAQTQATRMTLSSIGVNIPNLATYADNAAALLGGLVAGDLYRTSTGVLMVTY